MHRVRQAALLAILLTRIPVCRAAAIRTSRVAVLRRRSGRHEVLAADRHQRRQRAAAARRLAVEALGDAAGAGLSSRARRS